jgi:hypothetical protein
VAPRTPVEDTLARLFAEVLTVHRVGIDDDFFDLGGASIASLELAAAAAREGLPLQPEAIFEHRTIRVLAAALAGTGPAETSSEGDCAMRGAN